MATLTVGAMLLAGCGGGEETAETAETSTTAGGDSAPGAENGKTAKGKAQGERDGSSRSATPAPTSSEPLPNESTKEVAPGVPTVKGGDNSIQEFGTEGPSSERVEASRTLQAYLDARAARDAAGACSYIGDSAKRELRQLMERAPPEQQGGERPKPPNCVELLRKILAVTPVKQLRSEAQIDVRSMRIEDGRAFLVYEDGEGAAAQIAMVDEDGEWQVAVVSGAALIPAGAEAGAPS